MVRLLILLCIALLAGCGAAPAAPTATAAPTSAPAAATEPAPTVTLTSTTPGAAREQGKVVEVIDGDMISVRFDHGGVETVRYLSVDTPETKNLGATIECFGQEAVAKNTELVIGRTVQLERDVSDRDRFNHLLRYVWVIGDDGALRLVNQELVKWGFAAATSLPPDVKYQALLRAAEQEARAEKRGLWAVCAGPHQRLPRPAPEPAVTATPAP